MAARLSASRAGIFISASGTHFSKRLSKPQGLAGLEGLGELIKNHSLHRVFNPRPSGL
jgi:hypothetical protein